MSTVANILKRRRANLTQLEVPALPEKFNLTDGHVHQNWSESQEHIIDLLPDIFRGVSREDQPELEWDFLRKFLSLAGQSFRRVVGRFRSVHFGVYGN